MNETTQPMRIPEAMGPSDIGPYLKELREYFTLTTQDVSAQLHIRVRYIEALEAGQFDQLPGTVYARGYIHSYAEFLGLDAEQVAAQCFPATPAVAAAVMPTPAPQEALAFRMPELPLRMMVGAVVGLLVLGLLVTQWTTAEQEQPQSAPAPVAAAVAPVPEALLDSMRDMLMPTASNAGCLTSAYVLACVFASPDMQQLLHPEDMLTHAFVPDMRYDIIPERPPEPVEKKSARSASPEPDRNQLPEGATEPKENP